jgi:hypothetical protein
VSRNTLAFSKKRRELQHQLDFWRAYATFVRPHRSLRLLAPTCAGPRRWLPRTPAMAAGLSEHVWTMDALLTFRHWRYQPYSGSLSAAIKFRHFTGIEALLWGSDFPHPEGTWPHTREVLERLFAGVDATERAAILGGTLAHLCGRSPRPTEHPGARPRSRLGWRSFRCPHPDTIGHPITTRQESTRSLPRRRPSPMVGAAG